MCLVQAPGAEPGTHYSEVTKPWCAFLFDSVMCLQHGIKGTGKCGRAEATYTPQEKPFCQRKELADVRIRRRHWTETMLKCVARLCIVLGLPGFKKRTSRKILPRGPGNIWVGAVLLLDIYLIFHQSQPLVKSLIKVQFSACLGHWHLGGLGAWGLRAGAGSLPSCATHPSLFCISEMKVQR